jgi:hypothetical protein
MSNDIVLFTNRNFHEIAAMLLVEQETNSRRLDLFQVMQRQGSNPQQSRQVQIIRGHVMLTQ